MEENVSQGRDILREAFLWCFHELVFAGDPRHYRCPMPYGEKCKHRGRMDEDFCSCRNGAERRDCWMKAVCESLREENNEKWTYESILREVLSLAACPSCGNTHPALREEKGWHSMFCPQCSCAGEMAKDAFAAVRNWNNLAQAGRA